MTRPISFSGQVVVVTGSGRGLGRAYARDFARRGARVVVHSRPSPEPGRPSSAEAVAQEIRAAGGECVAVAASLEQDDGPAELVDGALDAFGRIDALVNNAGLSSYAPFDVDSRARLADVLAVHVTGAFAVTQLACRSMRASGYGRIVMTSSHVGVFGREHAACYGAAKAAVLGLTNVLAIEEEPHGILVNAVLPMAFTRPPDLSNPATRTRVAPIAPYWNRMDPAFIVPLVTYLASDACTTTHGLFSAVGGRYSSVFTGVTAGWSVASDEPPAAEDIAEHLGEITDRARYDVPLSMGDDLARVARLATTASGES